MAFKHLAGPNLSNGDDPMPKASIILTLSSSHNLASGYIADELGTVKARIADLETP